MKQHITVEQLNELEEEKFCDLFELLGIKTNLILSEKHVNIGKMIEILTDFNCNEYPTFETDETGQIRVSCSNDLTVGSNFNDELCDSLWEVVSILEL